MASDFYDLNIRINGQFQNAAQIRRQLERIAAPINVKVNANIDAIRNLTRPQTATLNIVVENRRLLDGLERQIARISGMGRINIELNTPGIDRARQTLSGLSQDIQGISRNLIGLQRVRSVTQLGSSFQNAAAQVTQFRTQAAQAEAAIARINRLLANPNLTPARQNRLTGLLGAAQASRVAASAAIPGALTAADRAAITFLRGNRAEQATFSAVRGAIDLLTQQGRLSGVSKAGRIRDEFGRNIRSLPANEQAVLNQLISDTARNLGFIKAQRKIGPQTDARRLERLSSSEGLSTVEELQQRADFQRRLAQRKVQRGQLAQDKEVQERFALEANQLVVASTRTQRRVKAEQNRLTAIGTEEERFRFAQQEAQFATKGQLPGIAKQFGVTRQLATGQLNTGRTFELSRIAQKPDTQIQLGFALAYGGLPSFLGAAAGGATRLGSSGAVLGSTVTQAFLGGVVDPIKELFHEITEQVKEAGLAFQRSILGIASIGLANTEFVGPGGQPLAPGRQLALQSKRAESIQLQARAKLLPLGIAGQTEATFVQGIVSALGQRGLSPSAQQVAEISELIGGAIQAQRPGLLENTQLLLRDIQDVLGGGAQAKRTILSQLIRPALGGLQSARTSEDIVAALRGGGLASFAQAATQLENPIVQLNKLSGQFDLLKTNAGIKFLDALTPSLKRLLDTLNPESASGKAINKAAENLGDTLGKIAGSFNDFTKTLLGLAPAVDAILTKSKEAAGAAQDVGIGGSILATGGLALAGGAALRSGVLGSGVLGLRSILTAEIGPLIGAILGPAALSGVVGAVLPFLPLIAGVTIAALAATDFAAQQAAAADRQINEQIEKTGKLAITRRGQLEENQAEKRQKTDSLVRGAIEGLGLRGFTDKFKEELASSPEARSLALGRILKRDFGVSPEISSADLVRELAKKGAVPSELFALLSAREGLPLDIRAEERQRLEQLTPFTGQGALARFDVATAFAEVTRLENEIAATKAGITANKALLTDDKAQKERAKLVETQEKEKAKLMGEIKELDKKALGRGDKLDLDAQSNLNKKKKEFETLTKEIEALKRRPEEEISDLEVRLSKLLKNLETTLPVAKFKDLATATDELIRSYEKQIRVLDKITPSGIKKRADLELEEAVKIIDKLAGETDETFVKQRDDAIAKLPELTLTAIGAAGAKFDFVQDLLSTSAALDNRLNSLDAKIAEALKQAEVLPTPEARQTAAREALLLGKQRATAVGERFGEIDKFFEGIEKVRDSQNQLQKQINQESSAREELNQKIKAGTEALSRLPEALSIGRLERLGGILGQAQSFTQQFGRLPRNLPSEVSGALSNPFQAGQLREQLAEAQVVAATREYEQFLESGKTQEELLRDEVTKNTQALAELTSTIAGLREKQAGITSDFFTERFADPNFARGFDNVSKTIDDFAKEPPKPLPAPPEPSGPEGPRGPSGPPTFDQYIRNTISGNLPPNIRNYLAKSGFKLLVAPKISTVDPSASQRPPGYPVGSTYDDAGGAYNEALNAAIVSPGRRDIGAVGLHESFHGFDKALGKAFGLNYISEHPELQAAIQKDIAATVGMGGKLPASIAGNDYFRYFFPASIGGGKDNLGQASKEIVAEYLTAKYGQKLPGVGPERSFVPSTFKATGSIIDRIVKNLPAGSDEFKTYSYLANKGSAQLISAPPAFRPARKGLLGWLYPDPKMTLEQIKDDLSRADWGGEGGLSYQKTNAYQKKLVEDKLQILGNINAAEYLRLHEKYGENPYLSYGTKEGPGVLYQNNVREFSSGAAMKMVELQKREADEQKYQEGVARQQREITQNRALRKGAKQQIDLENAKRLLANPSLTTESKDPLKALSTIWNVINNPNKYTDPHSLESGLYPAPPRPSTEELFLANQRAFSGAPKPSLSVSGLIGRETKTKLPYSFLPSKGLADKLSTTQSLISSGVEYHTKHGFNLPNAPLPSQFPEESELDQALRSQVASVSEASLAKLQNQAFVQSEAEGIRHRAGTTAASTVDRHAQALAAQDERIKSLGQLSDFTGFKDKRMSKQPGSITAIAGAETGKGIDPSRYKDQFLTDQQERIANYNLFAQNRGAMGLPVSRSFERYATDSLDLGVDATRYNPALGRSVPVDISQMPAGGFERITPVPDQFDPSKGVVPFSSYRIPGPNVEASPYAQLAADKNARAAAMNAAYNLDPKNPAYRAQTVIGNLPAAMHGKDLLGSTLSQGLAGDYFPDSNIQMGPQGLLSTFEQPAMSKLPVTDFGSDRSKLYKPFAIEQTGSVLKGAEKPATPEERTKQLEAQLGAKQEQQDALGESFEKYNEKLQAGVKEGKIGAKDASDLSSSAELVTTMKQILVELQKTNTGALETQFGNALGREYGG